MKSCILNVMTQKNSVSALEGESNITEFYLVWLTHFHMSLITYDQVQKSDSSTENSTRDATIKRETSHSVTFWVRKRGKKKPVTPSQPPDPIKVKANGTWRTYWKYGPIQSLSAERHNIDKCRLIFISLCVCVCVFIIHFFHVYGERESCEAKKKKENNTDQRRTQWRLEDASLANKLGFTFEDRPPTRWRGTWLFFLFLCFLSRFFTVCYRVLLDLSGFWLS